MVSRDRSGKERDLKSREPTKKGFATQLSSNVPSMISISSLSVLPSLTVMTPSLPTFFMASLLREFIMTEINKNTTNKILHGLTVNKILIINLLSYWELRHKLIKNYFYKLKFFLMEFFPNKLAYCGITVCRDCGHLKQNFSFSNNEHCLGTRKTQFYTTMRVHRNNNIFFFYFLTLYRTCAISSGVVTGRDMVLRWAHTASTAAIMPRL